jgi:ABC-2 type transport system ATP-binding protein
MGAADTAGCIRAQGLERRFGANRALAGVDLRLGPGGIAGLLGPNGSGKSTLLRILIGLVRPDAGTAEIDGVAVRGDGTAARRRASYSPGEIGLYGELTCRAHLDWLLRGRTRAERARARTLAEGLGLPLSRRVRAFSHGMKRQLLFAAALAPNVRVRILDEISEGLDPSKRGAVLELLEQDARAGTTILLSSHHLGEVENVCDRYLFLCEGRLLRDEDARSFRERARRLLHLAFPALDEGGRARAESLAQRLAPLRAQCEHSPQETRLVLDLPEADPRSALALLERESGLPPPLLVRFGELSLTELYRDLYGVEGV